MVTYCISSDCVALFLAPEEPIPLRSAVDSCLCEMGLRPWRDMEAELFSCPDGSLLIARPRAPIRQRLSPAAPRLRRSGRAL